MKNMGYKQSQMMWPLPLFCALDTDYNRVRFLDCLHRGKKILEGGITLYAWFAYTL